MSNENPVLLNVIGSVLVITLNRPQVANALNRELLTQLGQALWRLKTDDSIRAAVLQGANGTFCSGMDLGEFSNGLSGFNVSRKPRELGQALSGLIKHFRFQQAEKPLIAAVEGAALAGGFELMHQCDMIVVAKNAKLGLPEVSRGLVAFGGVLTTLPHQLPVHLANELSLLGQPIDGQRAYDIGLANRVVEPGASEAAALEIATAIAENAPAAVAASRKIMRDSRNWSVGTAFARQLRIALPILLGRDAREGAKAFKEKRQPVWNK